MAQDQVRNDGPRSLGTAALRSLGFLILAALMTVLIVVQQRAAGAYMAEFSAAHPDEAGHVVTGLMMSQYLAAGFPAPLAFVADFGLHYPRVVLGLWPPFYYVLEGLWFLLLNPSTPAVLLLPAVLAALLVASTGWAAAHRLGALPGVAAGAVLMVLPALRQATIVVGLDLPLALLMLWAALAYAAYLRSARLRHGLLFGLLASVAILTKATGLALLLLPPLAVIAIGRFGLLRARAFWWPLLLVVILAGPWTIGTFPMVQAARPLSAVPEAGRLAVLGGALFDQLGVVLSTLAAAGAVFAVIDGRRPGAPPLLTVLALLCLAFALVLSFEPLAGPEVLMPLYAPLLILAAAGGLRLLGLLSASWTTLAGLLVALVMLLAALPALMAEATKPVIGMDAVAQTFLADTSRPPAILVVADAQGEGALIAAVAQRDRARRSFVVPARAALAVPGPGPAAGAPLYATSEDLIVGLDRLGIGYLAIAQTTGGAEGLLSRQMDAVLGAYSERFRLLGRFPRADGTGETRLFAMVEAPHADAVPMAPASPAQ